MRLLSEPRLLLAAAGLQAALVEEGGEAGVRESVLLLLRTEVGGAEGGAIRELGLPPDGTEGGHGFRSGGGQRGGRSSESEDPLLLVLQRRDFGLQGLLQLLLLLQLPQDFAADALQALHLAFALIHLSLQTLNTQGQLGGGQEEEGG